MSLDMYYQKFYIQEYTRVPSGFPPPHEWVKELGDGAEVMGLFIPDQSTEMLITAAPNIRTRGRFITDSGAELDSSMTLRHAELDFFISPISDPLTAPKFSPTQSKRLFAQVVERPLQTLQE